MLLRRMLSLRLRTVMMDTKSIESGKKKNKTKKDDANPVTNYSKYSVGGESEEVPASTELDEN